MPVNCMQGEVISQSFSQEWLHRSEVGEFYRKCVLNVNWAHEKLMNKDPGEKRE